MALPESSLADWPNAAFSRFVDTRAVRWHVQSTGTGPGILLLHGAGGASHSWRDVLPALARTHRCLAVDLPGQGFSQKKVGGRFSLPHMAEDLAALLITEDFTPDLIVGHSAGAAIALQLVLDGCRPKAVLALNGALSPFQGLAGLMFPAMARTLALGPFVPEIFARSATPAMVASLIGSTGSRISPEGLAQYTRLISRPDHVRATLRMMADWALPPLIARFSEIDLPVHLHLGEEDRAVPLGHTLSVAADLADARITTHPGAGHLMHEEDPERFATLIAAAL